MDQEDKRPLLKTGLVLVGAGLGKRMGWMDKAFVLLGEQPLIYWPTLAAQGSELIHNIVFVLSPANVERGQKMVEEHGFSKITRICAGGERRQDSVKIGIDNLPGCDWVLIHDIARPFLDTSLIEGGLEAVKETGAAVAAIPTKDTLKFAHPNLTVAETPKRENLWTVQTPQVFRFDIIADAYNSQGEATDDASLVERLGYEVKLYTGSHENIKVTTPEDLALAEIILRKRGQCV